MISPSFSFRKEQYKEQYNIIRNKKEGDNIFDYL
jgi:hypothetical protein